MQTERQEQTDRRAGRQTGRQTGGKERGEAWVDLTGVNAGGLTQTTLIHFLDFSFCNTTQGLGFVYFLKMLQSRVSGFDMSSHLERV